MQIKNVTSSQRAGLNSVLHNYLYRGTLLGTSIKHLMLNEPQWIGNGIIIIMEMVMIYVSVNCKLTFMCIVY